MKSITLWGGLFVASVWNKGLCVSIFGESHGEAIGVTIDNVPPGIEIDFQRVDKFLSRRAPSSHKTGSTSRSESDKFKVLSGIYKGKTAGTPICAVTQNEDFTSSDYENIEFLPRPGHADFTGSIRYEFSNDPRGGGHFSGRLTAPITFVGAICEQMLEHKGIRTFAHISSIGNIKDLKFCTKNITINQLEEMAKKSIAVLDDSIIAPITDKINRLAKEGDSVGGTVECVVLGVPAGIGSPIFDGLENHISCLAFAIPGVKGIEFGAGFACAHMLGSENNDEFYIEDEKILTKTNNHGGVLGGISSGMPIIFNVAIKPTPTISKKQRSVNLKTLKCEEISVCGRHDSCIAIRAVPVVESVANIAILSQIICQGEFLGG